MFNEDTKTHIREVIKGQIEEMKESPDEGKEKISSSDIAATLYIFLNPKDVDVEDYANFQKNKKFKQLLASSDLQYYFNNPQKLSATINPNDTTELNEVKKYFIEQIKGQIKVLDPNLKFEEVVSPIVKETKPMPLFDAPSKIPSVDYATQFNSQPSSQFWAPKINTNKESKDSSVNKECDYRFKFILLGDPGVGQTALIRRCIEDSFVESSFETFGYKSPSFESRKIQVGDKQIDTEVWDMNGQKSYESHPQCFLRADVTFLVFDLTDRSSLESIQKHWYSNLATMQNNIRILIGTKADLQAERTIEEETIKQVVQELGLDGFAVTSAKTGYGVEKAFREASEKVMKSIEARKQPAEKNWLPPVNLDNDKEKKSSCTLM